MPLVAGCVQIASLDRNWRLYGGTTGPGPQEGLYQENTTLFPDLDGFFEFIHDNHLHIFFNVRCALSRIPILSRCDMNFLRCRIWTKRKVRRRLEA